MLLARSLSDYLTGASESRLDFTAGEPVVAPLPAGVEATAYVLRTPSGEAVRQTVPPGRSELSIPTATEPGAYRLEAGSEIDRRFVVNLADGVGRLERVETDELIDSLGGGPIEVLRGAEALANAIDLGRVGRELFGWVLLAVAVALLGEQWVSNRYYRDAEGETLGGTPG